MVVVEGLKETKKPVGDNSLQPSERERSIQSNSIGNKKQSP